jgi:hypothetical protein
MILWLKQLFIFLFKLLRILIVRYLKGCLIHLLKYFLFNIELPSELQWLKPLFSIIPFNPSGDFLWVLLGVFFLILLKDIIVYSLKNHKDNRR